MLKHKSRNTSNSTRKPPDTPRRYETPEGVRLNVAAIVKKHPGKITYAAFHIRQRNGWASLNGGRLEPVEKLATLPSGRRKREQTFLEHKADTAIEARPLDEQVTLADGTNGLTIKAVVRRLKVAKGTLWEWEQSCRWLGGKPLRPEPAKVRCPATGLWHLVYRESKIVEVEDAVKAAKQPLSKLGVCVSRKDLMRSLDLSLSTVMCYEKSGILTRIETPNPKHPPSPAISYCQAEYDNVEKILADRAAGRFEATDGEPCLTIMAAAKAYGWPDNTLRNTWEKNCPYLPSRKLIPEWYIDPIGGGMVGAGQRRRGYRIRDLETIKAARCGVFSGYYFYSEGVRRVNLALASEQTGISRRTLTYYINDRCQLLPEGKLPARLERRPNNAEHEEYAVLESDLHRLTLAIGEAVRSDKNDRDWQTATAICRRHRIEGITPKWQVFNLLDDLRSAGNLSGVERLSPYKVGGKPRFRTRVYFNVPELLSLLANRSLGDVAAEYSKPTAKVHQGEVVAEVRGKSRRGRKTKDSTQAIYKLCYLEYVTHNRTATETMGIVNLRHGEGTIMEESTVRMYAGRYLATTIPLGYVRTALAPSGPCQRDSGTRPTANWPRLTRMIRRAKGPCAMGHGKGINGLHWLPQVQVAERTAAAPTGVRR
jgi:hypothetical protein